MLDRLAEVPSVELKMNVPADQRMALSGLHLDAMEGRLREVFFFDTPDLALYHHGVVVRARRTQGADDDTVVKLRPATPDELSPAVRASKNLKLEMDMTRGAYVVSASLKGSRRVGAVRQASPATGRWSGCSPRSSGRSSPSMHRRASAGTSSCRWDRSWSSCSSSYPRDSRGDRRSSSGTTRVRFRWSSCPPRRRPRTSSRCSPKACGSCATTGSAHRARRSRRRERRSSSSPASTPDDRGRTARTNRYPACLP
jgi:hypothetical protein